MIDKKTIDEVLSDTDNKFVVIDNQQVEMGFENLEDAFELISEILNFKGILTDEEKYEFDDLSKEMTQSIDIENQDDIDDSLKNLLDRFNILNPYYILKRETLEGENNPNQYLEDDTTEYLQEKLSEDKLIFTPDKTCSGKRNCNCRDCQEKGTKIKKFKDFLKDQKKVITK